MKGRSLTLTALIAILAGVVLIIANRSIYSTGVVITGGILFIVAGVLNTFVFNGERKHDPKGRGPVASTFSLIASIGAVVLGVCMIIFQTAFTVLVPYIFGIIVAFLACYQFYVLAIGVRPTTLPGWFYLAPVILIGGAIYIFFRQPDTDDYLIMLSSGISLAFFGLITRIEAIMLTNSRKKIEADANGREEKEVKTIEASKDPADTASDHNDQ